MSGDLSRERLEYLSRHREEREDAYRAGVLADAPAVALGQAARVDEEVAMAREILRRRDDAARPRTGALGPLLTPKDVDELAAAGRIVRLDRKSEEQLALERMDRWAAAFLERALELACEVELLHNPGDIHQIPALAWSFAQAVEQYRRCAITDHADKLREEAGRAD